MLVNVGKGITITVDTTAMPLEAMDHVIMIGLRNILMDSHASITSDEYPDANAREAAARAMVEKKLAALMSGEVRVQSTREGDPIKAEENRLAILFVKSQYPSRRAVWDAKMVEQGLDPKTDKAKFFKIAATTILNANGAAAKQIKADARKNVESSRTAPTADLADIGL